MYVERTLTLGDDAITGQFRVDDDGRARFEGAFTLKRGETLVDADGVAWIVARVKQADVGKKQPPYAWADLRLANAVVEGEAVDVEPEPVAEPEPLIVEDEPAASEPEPDPAPVAPKKKRGAKAEAEATDAAD
ncbi:MAG: hypothetical protein ACRC7C_14425 [Beijerinckiaceae bacterium]